MRKAVDSGDPKRSRFVALGVAQGDAFFVERKEGTTLVDGGRSASTFGILFQRLTRRTNVNYLVCTHNDDDHAQGILGFLRVGLTADEVWLPAIWCDRLSDLLSDWDRFQEELVDEISDLPPQTPGSLEDYDERYVDEPVEEVENQIAADELLGMVEGARDAETPSDLLSWSRPLPFISSHGGLSYGMVYHSFSSTQARVLADSLKAVELIKAIFVEAIHRGCRIRWFKHHDRLRGGGIPGVLEPVNSVEVRRLSQRRYSAFRFASLSRSNRRSLVFCSPSSEGNPGVLLTADSLLDFPQPIKWLDGMIVTAPHHGAESNGAAYTRFARETRSRIEVRWVRSDGRFPTRPGVSYLSVAGLRFCTLCRGYVRPKQNVWMTPRAGRWHPVGRTRACMCT
jgi:hypothetical protein